MELIPDDVPILYEDIERAINERLLCRVATVSGEDFICFITKFDGVYAKTKTMCGIDSDDTDEKFMDRTLQVDLIMMIDLDIIHVIPYNKLTWLTYQRDEVFFKKKKRRRKKIEKEILEQADGTQ